MYYLEISFFEIDEIAYKYYINSISKNRISFSDFISNRKSYIKFFNKAIIKYKKKLLNNLLNFH